MYEFTTKTVGLLVLMFFVQEAETSARIVLTADPQRSNVMSGETVRLTCEVEDSDPFTQWEYSWKKLSGANETTIPSYTAEGFSAYTLSRVTESDSAQYWCKAKTENRELISSAHTLTVTSPPPAVLTLNPAWRKFYPTEKVTLKCEIQSRQTEWGYLWYRDGAPMNSALSRGNEHTIPALDQSHRGRYSCKGEIPGRAVYTEMSKDVTLTVDGEAPKPLLTRDPPSGEIFTGDTVTLSCRVGTDPVGWEYLWFKETWGAALNSTDSSSTDGSIYTIRSAAVSHGGEYWCQAWRGKPALYTPYSDSLQLSITAPPPAVLTLNPAWRTFYPTEKVTLKCEIQSRQTGWSYLWHRDGAPINSVLSRGNEYTIPALDQSHSGRYSCKGAIPRRAVYTEMSKDVTLTVDARPQAVLTLETAWTEIFRSDSLTLRCQVEGSSAEWNYTWYRDGRHLPLDPSGDRLALTAGNDSYSSEYKCRGNRTGQPSYTEISEGFRANNIVSCTVENLARIAVGAAILLFLSFIVNEGFWRRARKTRRCCI